METHPWPQMTSIRRTLPSRSPRGQTRSPGLQVPEGHVWSGADAALEPLSGLVLHPTPTLNRPPLTVWESPSQQRETRAGTGRSHGGNSTGPVLLCLPSGRVLGGLWPGSGQRDGLGVRGPEDPRPAHPQA